MSDLGDVLRQLREASRFSREELADEAGVSRSSVYRIENAETESPDVATLGKLMAAMGHTLSEFFARVEGIAPKAVEPAVIAPTAPDDPTLYAVATRFIAAIERVSAERQHVGTPSDVEREISNLVSLARTLTADGVRELIDVAREREALRRGRTGTPGAALRSETKPAGHTKRAPTGHR